LIYFIDMSKWFHLNVKIYSHDYVIVSELVKWMKFSKNGHQGEATTSQLGWHLEEPPSYAAKLNENFIKKQKGKQYTRGGTRQKPSK